MPFSAVIGTANAQLGNIELGAVPSGTLPPPTVRLPTFAQIGSVSLTATVGPLATGTKPDALQAVAAVDPLTTSVTLG